MGTIFLVSWLAQSIAGCAAYNEARLRQLQAPISWTSYVTNADFWARTLQNWQSEFLAVGSMAVLRHLPARARLTREQAGGRAAPQHRSRGLRPPPRPTDGRPPGYVVAPRRAGSTSDS